MSIEVKGITKLYGQQKALDNVSFTVATGEIVGFIGPNGAGKSTMMKIITGYIPQTEGTVLVNEMETLEHSLEIRKMIGYLPENNPLYTDMYVREYLEMVEGIYQKGQKSKKASGKKSVGVGAGVEDMIALVGLEKEAHKKIGALSKGYRQRVGLAQALIHDPSVLILDEPTSGLDPNQIVEIRKFIGNLGRKKTILLSTHIMQEVEAICDRVIIINLGKIVANEKTEDLRKQESSLERMFQRVTQK
ncbi:MAG: ATP-binding cassette domain-containing protein [Bacteroidales bacterium]|jgi:ABC-2 type transport system ATP-binding protein|nr:ATP-binding cassette domain-containing protein [Bacteroidales bacterium]MDD2571281.1 ATP-binding cassette domain-containing protein [Bacteroidales bacterium]MDD2812280.1 ATP-binding cassette domain-containing protein [Bacteroidales bacterium]MDD3385647.1 ATP-binding cassette domain-containing protein [Bacteroidales bacterium]MDD3811980.1 ATP-binding cassette domain-containing protein [Bacteroidales bacterium]